MAGSSPSLYNEVHDLNASFEPHLVRVWRDAEPWRLLMRLEGVGRAGALWPMGAVRPIVHDGRVVYRRHGVTEWYTNDVSNGIEQGFDVDARPAGEGPLVVESRFGGGTRARATDGGQTIVFWYEGQHAMTWSGVVANDARGRHLPSRLEVSGDRLRIVVDDEAALYPIAIDPHLGDCPGAWCNDGNPCTRDICQNGGATCTHTFEEAAEGTSCGWGDHCCNDSQCHADCGSTGGTCPGFWCSDGDPCTLDFCDDNGQTCTHAFDPASAGTPCSWGGYCCPDNTCGDTCGAPSACDGRVFQMAGPPLVPSSGLAPGADRLVFQGGQAIIASGCPPAQVHAEQDPGVTLLEISWDDCSGLGPVQLVAAVDPQCLQLQGQELTVPGLGLTVQPFVPFSVFVQQTEWDDLASGGTQQHSGCGDEGGSGFVSGAEFLCENAVFTGVFECTPSHTDCFETERELFTGVDLFDAPPSTDWNYFGGRGSAMAEAGLCLLRDLQFSAPVLHAGAAAEQHLGFLHFDPVARSVSGYQRVKLCIPYVGCFDVRTQRFTATMVETALPSLDGTLATAGDFIVKSAHGLRVKAEEYVGGLWHIDGPDIPVVTPIGPVDITLTFDYGVDNHSNHAEQRAVWSNYANGPDEARIAGFFENPGLVDFSDVYGRLKGVVASVDPDANDLNPPLALGPGWDSQVGLGGRQADSTGTPWTPAEGERPDRNLTRARSSFEKHPTVAFNAEAKATYGIPIPDVLLQIAAVDISVSVAVNLEGAVASQLSIHLGEGVHPYYGAEFKSPIENMRRLAFDRRIEAFLGLAVIVAFDLHIDFNLPFLGDIDIHHDIEIPIADDTFGQDGAVALAESTLDPTSATAATDPRFTALQGWYGQSIPSSDGHIQSCLATPEEGPFDPPAPEYDPPTEDEPFPGPCNICLEIATQIGAVPQAVYATLVPHGRPPGLQDWDCNHLSANCYDLCFGHTVVKTAHEFHTPHCGLSPPLP